MEQSCNEYIAFSSLLRLRVKRKGSVSSTFAFFMFSKLQKNRGLNEDQSFCRPSLWDCWCLSNQAIDIPVNQDVLA